MVQPNWQFLSRERVSAAELGIPDILDGEIRESHTGFMLNFVLQFTKMLVNYVEGFFEEGEATIAPHENLTEDGTIVFGAISSSEEDQDKWILEIMKETNLPRRFLYWDSEYQRIELPLVVAESIANVIDAPVSLVEVLPTFERLEMTVIWLNQ